MNTQNQHRGAGASGTAHPPATPWRIIRTLKTSLPDGSGRRIAADARLFLQLETGTIRTAKIFLVQVSLSRSQVETFAECGLKDGILHEIHFDSAPESLRSGSFILVARRPGVTDDEGQSAQRLLEDLFGLGGDGRQHIFTQELFLLERALPERDLRRIAEGLLANPLIHHVEVGNGPPSLAYLPSVQLTVHEDEPSIDLDLPDERLAALSRARCLALSVVELKAIRDHLKSPAVSAARRPLRLPDSPTECELEIFAQTWSEHCKHKEFAGIIHYRDLETGQDTTIDSLFSTYIKRATSEVHHRLQRSGNDWLVKVFNDNAGVVRIDEDRLFVFKVETHNTPSALDPYGGALTGIVGNNRDPLGTGRGGARLLFNTDVLCFAPPDFDGELYPGQLHPRKIFAGVRQGIEDGGNKSGIPTVNGAIVFDDRYRGKPLVYCGTAGILPDKLAGRSSWEKEVAPGDQIVMTGGRVGKDGIHGATFSSAEIDEHAPATAVQIGSPITQKLMSDFLEEACRKGLVKCTTDNGAGGLSSSIGELASLSGGARVQLETVPLKYAGLKPWEIFLSESQERMTLVVEPRHWEELSRVAAHFEVEATIIGEFTDDGHLDVRYGETRVAYLSLEFLHDGVPRKTLQAEWSPPQLTAPDLPDQADAGELLLKVLSGLDVCSREGVIRQYDHEVKGRTVVKPLMGENGKAPQDAAVMRFDFDSYAGVAVSCGILPRYGDLDAYHMSAGAFDEAVRQIISVGGRLPDPEDPSCRFWSVNDNFCVPDSAYDPETNPDGKYKLAQLVRMCQALYDMSVFFGIPMTSGKDSMKNDFRHGRVKISVPPTILYSMAAKIDDVRRCLTSQFKLPGDLVYVVGSTYAELGGSVLLKSFGQLGDRVPVVRKEDARRRYLALSDATTQGLLASCHDLSDGGLAVALAEVAFGSGLGVDLRIPVGNLTLLEALFAESHSRFVVSVEPRHRDRFERIVGSDATLLGTVTVDPRFVVRHGDRPVIDLAVSQLLAAWERGLHV